MQDEDSVQYDSVQLFQACVTLYKDFIKHSKKKGTITLTIAQLYHVVRVMVMSRISTIPRLSKMLLRLNKRNILQ